MVVDQISYIAEKYNLKTCTLPHNNIANLKLTWFCSYNIYKYVFCGVKIHVSATILNSFEILSRVMPWLFSNECRFKVISSNILLKMINDNVFGYIHSGKFITIYPSNYNEFLKIASTLADLLRGYKSIKIPFTHCFREDSIVYYEQYSPIIKHDFVVPYSPVNLIQSEDLLLNKYILIETIRQRARGGTYLALQVFKNDYTSRKIIIKEARDFSEIEESGIDAVTRLHWQFKMLTLLHTFNITPQPYELIKQKHSTFLTMEYLPGLSLREEIHKTKSFEKTILIKIVLEVAQHIQQLHAKNIYFLELCPDNIIILSSGHVKLIDCDLCYTENAPSFIGWNYGTPGFFPSSEALIKSGFVENKWFYLRDMYALGSILFSLLFPHWYKNLFLGVTTKKSNDDKIRLIKLLPNNIQNILKKSMLMKEPFINIEEFINLTTHML